ncbi:MAG: hypothetical protein V8T36_12655 [Ruthenibacterium lactatiformans]
MQQAHLAKDTPASITQSHRFGQDALLLAHFCRVRRAEAVCDLGTGCGVIPLRWHDRGHRGPCLALDIAPGAVAQLHAAVQAAEAGISRRSQQICGTLQACTHMPRAAMSWPAPALFYRWARQSGRGAGGCAP